jgi:hypothetical protein
MAHAALAGVAGSSCPDTSTPHVGARLAALARDSDVPATRWHVPNRLEGASHAATQNQT